MEQKYLYLIVNPEEGYGQPVSEEIWRALMDHIVLPHCDRFGVLANVKSGKPEGVGAFKSWTLRYLDTHTCRVLSKGGESHVVAAYSLAEDAEKLKALPLDRYRIYDESYPSDNLFFFDGDKVFMEMLVYEYDILFPYSTDERKQLINELVRWMQAQFPTDRFVLTERKLDMHGKHVKA